MPDRAATSPSKNSHGSWPTGETTPNPVTTTRGTTTRRSVRGRLFRDQGIDHRGEIVQRPNVGDRFLRNGNVEMILELEQKLEEAERIDAQPIDRSILVNR